MILGFCKPFGPVVYFNVTDFSFRAAFSFPLASVLYFINPQFWFVLSVKEAADRRKLVSKWHPTTKGTLRRNYRVPSKSEGRRALKAIASLLSEDDHFVDATSHKVITTLRKTVSFSFSVSSILIGLYLFPSISIFLHSQILNSSTQKAM